MTEKIRFTGLRNQKTNTLLDLSERYVFDEKGNILRQKSMEELKEEEKERHKKSKGVNSPL